MSIHPAYFAGIIDGEGSIMLVRTGNSMLDGLYTSWTVKVQVANTDKELLFALQKCYGGVIVETNKLTKDRNWRAGYRLQWFGSEAIDVIKCVQPYLICKLEQGQIAIDAMHKRNSEGGKGKRKSPALIEFLNEASASVKALNRRGLN